MAKLLEVKPGHRVLEPSAGTGVLLGALGGSFWGNTPETQARPVAVEINNGLCDNLRRAFPLTDVICSDFLEFKPEFMRFDKIVANPPFSFGSDILHINHALTMLKPGGRLVAICAGGPRQEAQLKPLCSLWEPLPAGTFKDAGTMVNSVLLVIDKPGDEYDQAVKDRLFPQKPTQPKLF
jgi:16S rRNA G1207 methylase RsmC